MQRPQLSFFRPQKTRPSTRHNHAERGCAARAGGGAGGMRPPTSAPRSNVLWEPSLHVLLFTLGFGSGS